MSNKIKIFTISDHPLSPSGVGTQTKYMIEGMLKTGKYEFVSFGGAIKHPGGMAPQKTEEWGEDWVIWPVEGYGTPQMVRAMLHQQKPDILWFMTDPRFYGWLWQIENEIREHVPMIYYHVWDNYPYPKFNEKWYTSNDHVACISKLTHDIVQTVAPGIESSYLPHAVNPEIFKRNTDGERNAFTQAHPELKDKFICFWNSRNARRKQSGTLIFWFKKFLDRVGHDKAVLIMHTDVKDVHGQDLQKIVVDLGITDGQVLFSQDKVNPAELALVYNAANLTICISDAEGFGLSTLESLSCGTPILVNMTGGLQDQVTDGEKFYGAGLEPSSKAVIGSQEVPYIYEDRLNEDDFVNAMVKLYEMDEKEYEQLRLDCAEWARKRFSFDNMINSWDELFTRIHDEQGSWDTRTGYQPYEVRTY